MQSMMMYSHPHPTQQFVNPAVDMVNVYPQARFPQQVTIGSSYSNYQHLYNPTMVQYGPTQQPTGYYPQPAHQIQMQPPVVKRHNPYAPFGSSTFREEPVAPAFDAPASTLPLDFNADASADNGAMGSSGKYGHQHHHVTPEEILTHRGALVELCRTAPGSSFIQAALREGSPYTAQNVALIASELLPAAGTLLLDAHGCYVVKSVMERLHPAELQRFVRSITSDQQLVYSMCTHSLHTRRVVQYLMDSVDILPIAEVLVQRCVEISMTQQGCIVMQRAMDITPEPLRAQLFSTIFDNLVDFSFDPFANYVVQHMLEVGEKELISAAVLRAFRGSIVRMACNKFASNVMEKSLFHISPDAQHDLLHEMYDVDEEVLHSMLQDSFGNYLIQSSIALASFKDVFYINEKLKAVLQRTPYGHKIELRIERRLKGRPVGTRSPQIGANSKTSRQQRNPRDSIGAEQMEEPW